MTPAASGLLNGWELASSECSRAQESGSAEHAHPLWSCAAGRGARRGPKVAGWRWQAQRAQHVPITYVHVQIASVYTELLCPVLCLSAFFALYLILSPERPPDFGIV